MSKRSVILCLAAIVGIFIAHALYLRCVAEDAFISYRYAQNLAAGHGLTWNIGEAPVEGYTNFLWVILCAAAIKSGLSVIMFSQIVGILAGVGVVLAAYGFARVMGCSRAGATAASLVLALSGPLAAWSFSGMETVPFALCILLTVGLWIRFCKDGRFRDGVPGALAMLAASLLRPEGVMVACVTMAVCGVLWSSSRRTRMLLPMLVYSVPAVIYFVWRYNYFGFLLPNTFYAKTGGGLHQHVRGALYAIDFAVFYVLPLLSVVFLWLWSTAGTPRRGWNPSGWWAWLRGHPGVGLVTSVLAVYTAYIAYVGGDYMAMYRFFVPLAALFALLFGLCVTRVMATAKAQPGRRRLAWLLIGVVGVATLLPSSPLEARALRKPRFHHGRFQGIYRERWHTARLSVIGKFFAERRESYDDIVATKAIGAIGYYAKMKVLDIHGLTDPHIAHRGAGKTALGTGFPGHEKFDDAYVFSTKPTFYMFSRALTRHPQGYPPFGAELDAAVRESYVTESARLADAHADEEGYFTYLVRRDRQRAPLPGASE